MFRSKQYPRAIALVMMTLLCWSMGGTLSQAQHEGSDQVYGTVKSRSGIYLADLDSRLGLPISMRFDPDGAAGPAELGPNAITAVALGTRFRMDGKDHLMRDIMTSDSPALEGTNTGWRATHHCWLIWGHWDVSHPCPIIIQQGQSATGVKRPDGSIETDCLQFVLVQKNLSFSMLEDVKVSFSIQLSPNGTSRNSMDILENVVDDLPLIRAGLPGQQYFGVATTTPFIIADSVSPLSADPLNFANQDADGRVIDSAAATFVFDLGTLRPLETRVIELFLFVGLSDEDLRQAFIGQLRQERASVIDTELSLEPVAQDEAGFIFRVKGNAQSRDGRPTMVFLDLNGHRLRNGDLVKLVRSNDAVHEITQEGEQGEITVIKAPDFSLTLIAHNAMGSYVVRHVTPEIP